MYRLPAQCRRGRLRRPERRTRQTPLRSPPAARGHRREPGPCADLRKGQRMAAAKKPLVVITRRLPESVETRMRELFDARLNLDDKPMSAGELAETVKSADVLVPTVTDRIDSSVLSRAGDKLKLIANYGSGVDHIDVATALSRGITVTNTPGVLTEDTADMTMALILSVPRRLAEGAAVFIDDKPW